MSTATDILRSIEQRAERAIAQELHQMIQQVLGLRTALVLDDRAHADALLLKLDRLIDDQVVRPIDAGTMPPMPPMPPLPGLDELLPPSPCDYEVRFFDRDYGDLEEVAIVESFPLAVQVAADRHKADPADLSEAGWADGRGRLTVRSRSRCLSCKRTSPGPARPSKTASRHRRSTSSPQCGRSPEHPRRSPLIPDHPVSSSTRRGSLPLRARASHVFIRS